MTAKKPATRRKPKADKSPSTNGRPSDRNPANGQFVVGNAASKGNPLCQRVAQWRALLAKTLSDDDVIGVIQQLRAAALSGQPWAIVEFLNRTIGKVVPYADTEDGDALADLWSEHLARIYESFRREP